MHQPFQQPLYAHTCQPAHITTTLTCTHADIATHTCSLITPPAQSHTPVHSRLSTLIVHTFHEHDIATHQSTHTWPHAYVHIAKVVSHVSLTTLSSLSHSLSFFRKNGTLYESSAYYNASIGYVGAVAKILTSFNNNTEQVFMCKFLLPIYSVIGCVFFFENFPTNSPTDSPTVASNLLFFQFINSTLISNGQSSVSVVDVVWGSPQRDYFIMGE